MKWIKANEQHLHSLRNANMKTNPMKGAILSHFCEYNLKNTRLVLMDDLSRWSAILNSFQS